MSLRSPAYNSRFSHEAFEPLNRGDATIEIPLQQINNANSNNYVNGSTMVEKERPMSQAGLRRTLANRKSGKLGYEGEEDTINKMGIFYNKLLSSSLLVRYLVYILPLGIIFAIPMIVGATVAQGAEVGGVRIVWVFGWLLVVWVGLWASKLVAHYLPKIFQFLSGIVSSETRKYALLLRALEIPLSLAGAALVALSTFMPIMTRNPDTREEHARAQAAKQTLVTPHWETVVQRILAATMVAALIFLGERLFIQLISINYHRKQFSTRIRESKEQMRLLALMYDASRAMFPAFCAEFAEEDAIISDTLDVAFRKRRSKKGHARSGSATPLHLLRDVGRFGDKLTTAIGGVAKEITGKDVFNPNSATSIVVEALERNRSSEALAKRLWLSFVIEGHDALYLEDIVEVLGGDRQAQAEATFLMLDLDGNGDVSLDEMIMTVTEMGRERKAIANSMHDVDQAINVLDRMLCVVIFIVIIFIFVAFLNTSFVTTLATAGTALLSLSFVFSVTCQEILGSCIFLFVKHPFDIGDRIDLSTGRDQLIVEHISLLFTVFRRVTNHRTVQIPNIVLNTLWIENVSRSKAMREVITLPIHFDTTIEDIQLLRNELSKFVQDKDNSRDFQPDVEIEVQSVGELDKLELTVLVYHKSNWSNETLRAARRSKFMCALVLALRKVPIYGPGAGDPALGEAGNPRYSVTISDTMALTQRDEAKKTKEGKRMVPSTSAVETTTAEATQTQTTSQPVQAQTLTVTPSAETSATKPTLSAISETRALETLNERSPALDTARDDGTSRVEGGVATIGRDRKGSEAKEIEEMRGLLKRVATQGRRRRGESVSQHIHGQGQGVTPVASHEGGGAGVGTGGNAGAGSGYGYTTAYSAPPTIPPVVTGGNGTGLFGLSREASLHAAATSSRYAPPYNNNLHSMTTGASGSAPVINTNYQSEFRRERSESADETAALTPTVASHGDRFRGGYDGYDGYESEDMQSSVNAGTAYSAGVGQTAGQWRRGA